MVLNTREWRRKRRKENKSDKPEACLEYQKRRRSSSEMNILLLFWSKSRRSWLIRVQLLVLNWKKHLRLSVFHLSNMTEAALLLVLIELISRICLTRLTRLSFLKGGTIYDSLRGWIENERHCRIHRRDWYRRRIKPNMHGLPTP